MSAELVAHLGALGKLPFSQETYAVERVVRLALLGCSSRGGLCALLERELPNGIRARVRGLLLRDGDPLGEALSQTPWAIPPGAALTEAIAHIWRPCPDGARLAEELQRRVLGLALLEESETNAPLLAYAMIHERDEYSIPKADRRRPRPAFDRRQALAWEPFGDLSLIVGNAPLALNALSLSIPPSLRAFYGVHAGWRNGMWCLSAPEEICGWHNVLGIDGATLVRTETDGEERRADALLAFFSYGDDRSDLFDLSTGSDDPPVRAWGDGMLYAGPGVAFREWIRENLTLFLAAGDDEYLDDA